MAMISLGTVDDDDNANSVALVSTGRDGGAGAFGG